MSNIEKSKYLVELYNELIKEKNEINELITKNKNILYNILSTIEKLKKELKIMNSKINRIEEKINDLDQNGFRSETFLKYYERNDDLMENT